MQVQLCQSCLWGCRSGLRQFSQSFAQRKAVNYYGLLGVKQDANLEQIKEAFFDKSKKLHPDSDPSNPALHNQFVELNEAYRVLSKEQSRREYDFKIRHGYTGSQAFTSSSSYTVYKARTNTQDNRQYWEQLYQSHAAEMMSAERQKRMRKQNIRLAGYCILIMLFSIVVHTLLFSKLKQIHTEYMDEKDRVITKIYNESKERARVNGFKKQMEILRQRHAELMENTKTTKVEESSRR